MLVNDVQREDVLEYLGRNQVITLATHGADGIWAAALFYVNVAFDFFFLSAEHTRHARHIESNPYVAATIQQQYEDWTQIQGVQLEGVINRLEQENREKAIADYCLKYPAVAKDPRLQSALTKVQWYRLTPTRLYWIDNRGGLGNRALILENSPISS